MVRPSWLLFDIIFLNNFLKECNFLSHIGISSKQLINFCQEETQIELCITINIPTSTTILRTNSLAGQYPFNSHQQYFLLDRFLNIIHGSKFKSHYLVFLTFSRASLPFLAVITSQPAFLISRSRSFSVTSSSSIHMIKGFVRLFTICYHPVSSRILGPVKGAVRSFYHVFQKMNHVFFVSCRDGVCYAKACSDIQFFISCMKGLFAD